MYIYDNFLNTMHVIKLVTTSLRYCTAKSLNPNLKLKEVKPDHPVSTMPTYIAGTTY